MFPKDGTDVPEIRFPGFTDAWEQRKLGDLSESFEYGLNAAAKEYDGENKYIRITDINDNSRIFMQDNVTSPDADLSNADNYKLKEGDILFARTGASVNPYRGQIGGNDNCVSCSTALSLSLLGIDAEALPFANWMNRYIDHPDIAWKLSEQPIIERYDSLRDTIEQEMLTWGDGSICIITISMGHKGHAFVGFQFGGKTYYFDGQTGSLNCEDYFLKADRTTVNQFGNIKDAGYRFFRVDNAVLTGIGRNLVRFRDD